MAESELRYWSEGLARGAVAIAGLPEDSSLSLSVVFSLLHGIGLTTIEGFGMQALRELLQEGFLRRACECGSLPKVGLEIEPCPASVDCGTGSGLRP